MYYFLAIVKQNDVNNGKIIPSYILCLTKGNSQNRSGWRVYKAGAGLSNDAPKCLVSSLVDRNCQLMISFMSNYRTRDHMQNDRHYRKKEKKMKYYPKGALCWFGCNIYGQREGPVVFIKNVPDKNAKYKQSDSGLQQIKDANNKAYTFRQLLMKNNTCRDLQTSNKKCRLVQDGQSKYAKEKRKKRARRKKQISRSLSD